MPFPFPFTLYGASRASNIPSDPSCDFTYCYGGDWVQGKVGNYGMSFNGTNEYILSDTLNAQYTDVITIAGWVKADNFAGPMVIASEYRYSSANQRGWAIRTSTTGKIDVFATSAGDWTSPYISLTGTGTALVAGTWTHVAVVIDASTPTAKIYINGSLDQSGGGTGAAFNIYDSPVGYTLGGYWTGILPTDLVEIFAGELDEMAVWNVELTSTEISELYNSGDGARADSITPPGASDGDWSTGTNKKIGTYGVGQFDGSTNYISCSWDANLNFDYNDPFSISGWVKPTNLAGGDAYPAIMSKERYPGPTQLGFSVSLQDNGAVWFGMIANNGSNGYLYRYTAAGTVVDDTWYHIVWTYDGSNTQAGQKIYVNGAEATSTPNPSPTAFTTTIAGWPLYLGARGTGTDRLFQGHLDDFGIWDVELDSAAILEVYNSGSANIGALASGVSGSALQGYWGFENPGPGSTTISGSRGLDATMLGGMDGGTTGSLLVYYDWEIGDSNPVSGNFPTSRTVYDVTTASFHPSTAHNGTMGTYMDVADFGAWSQGKLGKYSLDFDGVNDYVDLPLGAATGSSNGQSGSIAAWIYADAISNYPVIFGASKDSGITDYMRCGISTNPSYVNNLTFASIVGSTWGPFEYATSAGTGNNGKVVVGEWTHVAWSSDGTTTSMYLNGTAASITSVGTGPAGRWFGDLGLTTGYNVQLGGIQYNGTNPEYALNGKLDEVSVWDGPLSQANITSLAAGAKANAIAPTSSVVASNGDWLTPAPASKLGTYSMHFPGGGGIGAEQYISASNMSDLATPQGTLAMWVKFAGSGYMFAASLSVPGSNGGTADHHFAIYRYSTSLYAALGGGNGTPALADKYLFASKPGVTFTDWNHVVLTWNNPIASDADMTIYLNGSNSGWTKTAGAGLPFTVGTDAASNGLEFLLGEAYSTDPLPLINFTGSMDELGIWNVALDQGAVDDLYNSGTGARADTVSSSNLICYYDFEGGPGSTVLTDRSTAGLDHVGTFMNAGWDLGTAAGPTPSLVSYYDMECNGPGSPILKDLSGNDLAGTLTNMSTGSCGSG